MNYILHIEAPKIAGPNLPNQDEEQLIYVEGNEYEITEHLLVMAQIMIKRALATNPTDPRLFYIHRGVDIFKCTVQELIAQAQYRITAK